MEAREPHLAEPSADALGALMPSAGHLVHMPAHIYIRVGRYDDAVTSNQRAIDADLDYIAQCSAQGLYPVAYYPHNIHFLWASATFGGRSELAIESADSLAGEVPADLEPTLDFLQDYLATPLFARIRSAAGRRSWRLPNRRPDRPSRPRCGATPKALPRPRPETPRLRRDT